MLPKKCKKIARGRPVRFLTLIWVETGLRLPKLRQKPHAPGSETGRREKREAEEPRFQRRERRGESSQDRWSRSIRFSRARGLVVRAQFESPGSDIVPIYEATPIGTADVLPQRNALGAAPEKPEGRRVPTSAWLATACILLPIALQLDLANTACGHDSE